jgi:hypothetical protein
LCPLTPAALADTAEESGRPGVRRGEELGITMVDGMREKSLLLEGASDVVLSLEEDGFLLRFLGGLVAVEESVDERFMGSSFGDGRSC